MSTTDDIPVGAPGRPLAEGHLDAHYLIVEKLKELEQRIEALENPSS